MKKLISILLSTIILSSVFSVCLSVSAVTNLPEEIDRGTTSDGWTYSINKIKNENTEKYEYFAYIGEYVGTKSETTLPVKINNYNVTGASPLLIKNNKYLKKLTIPDSTNKITYVNDNSISFWGSTTLEEVTIGSAVKNVYTSMFESDTKLKTVNFTKEFLAQKPYIGSRAFAKCTSLRNLVLPNGISGIADDALADAKNLETVNCGKDIEKFGIYNNVNLKKITLNCKNAKTELYFNNFGWEGVNHDPKTFNYKPVIVECYSGTEAEYYVNNVYPYWKGYEDDFKFVSLGQCEGTPYSHPTTAPPTTTAPYTVSVGEEDEFYLAGTFNDYTRDDSTKLIYNPTSKALEKEVTLDKGEYEFIVCDINTSHRFNLIKGGILGHNNCPDPSKFSITTDTAKVKFVFDGIKVRMYINEQEVTSTTLPPTTTISTSTTTNTTVPSTSASETASVPSTPSRPTVTAGTLELEKTNDTLFVGKGREYKYTFTCNDLINHVEFVSDKNTVAQVNLNKDNTFTVVPLSKGETTITATLYDRDNREVTKSTFTVTVKQPVNKITVKANNKTTLTNGKVFNVKKPNTKVQLNTTVGPTNANDKKVTYTSSNTSVATVNSKGLITTKKVGYTTITISSNDGNIKLNVKLTVGNTASKIAISPYKNISKVNSLTKINYSVYYGNKKANLYNIKPTWKSYKTSVATVDKNGNVTAKKKGICSIVATFNDGRSIYSKKCLVVVGNKVSNVVKTNYKNTIVLKKNKSVTLKAEVKNNNATYKDCNWYLGKNKYAKISNVKNKGNKSHFYTQAKVTAKKKGTCYVYCKTKDGSNKQLRYKIIIK